MKKLRLTLVTINLLFCCVLANIAFANIDAKSKTYAQREHFATFDEFYQSLPILTMPFDTKTLPQGKFIDSKYFHYGEEDYSYYDDPNETDPDHRYLTLQKLKAIGRFEIDNIRFVLFSFTFDSIGEGVIYDVYLLNAFDGNGKYLDELFLAGLTGHEDHGFLFSSQVNNNAFNVHIDANYQLGYFIDVNDGHYDYNRSSDLIYEFRDNQFWRKKSHPDCKKLNLKSYLSKLEKREFADITHVVAFNDYISCYPVSENLKTYQKIARYIESTHYYFLSDAEYLDLEEKIKIIMAD